MISLPTVEHSLTSLDFLSSVPSNFCHPSRLKMSLRDYIAELWQIMAENNAPLSVIVCQVMGDASEIQICLAQLTKIMRSVSHQTEDFVGLSSNDKVVLVLPRTNVEEAANIADKIINYHTHQSAKLEIISVHPSANSQDISLLEKLA